jgi:hypothetical protein
MFLASILLSNKLTTSLPNFPVAPVTRIFSILNNFN